MREDAAHFIRSLRRRLKMTQEAFAQALDVTVSTVNRWENGHSAPSRLAWRAVDSLARERGLSGDALAESSEDEDVPADVTALVIGS